MSMNDLRLADYTPRSQARVTETPVERAAVPCIDVHNHLGRWLSLDGGWILQDVDALLATMDACNVETVVNLDGRWGEDPRATLPRYDEAHPGRFLTFCHLDWRRLAEPGGFARLPGDLEAAAATGAKGIKVWKDLGLTHRD